MFLRSTLSLCAVTCSVVATPAINAFGEERAPGNRLVVHEWGTFTTLQDEFGDAVGGINADDEPVPSFVHRLNYNLVLDRQPRAPFDFAKGVPRSHPDVTMRLETPVVYFHPARSMMTPFSVNLEIAFRGGWLTEFFPQADVDAPGAKGVRSFGPIRRTTVGRLEWNDLQIGTDAAGPETDSPVWLAPRAVDAVTVTAAGGESERYLFYRGIGHVDSPLRVSQEATDDSLNITAQFPVYSPERKMNSVVPLLWLVDIRADKTCAFREINGFSVANDGRPRIVATTSARFTDSQYSANYIDDLTASMRAALIDDGLFADEADALLNTWRASYFETPGLRLFYLLPQPWTDHVMPMKLSVDAKLVRTMVGRVEIVTPRQRQLLAKIAAGPASNNEWRLTSKEPAMPADYRAFESLGRFRNALVLDELKRRPSKPLQKFIENYGLAAFVPALATGAKPSETPANTATVATAP